MTTEQYTGMMSEPLPGMTAEPVAMRIGRARLTAGLDRFVRLDMESHQQVFGSSPSVVPVKFSVAVSTWTRLPRA